MAGITIIASPEKNFGIPLGIPILIDTARQNNHPYVFTFPASPPAASRKIRR